MDFPILLALIKLVVGIALITKGADWFTNASVKISEATHVPKVVIGATIVSIATTMPEFTVSVYSSITDRPDFAVGNAIGSVVCNIGLILGSCLLIRPMLIDRLKITMQQGFIMIGAGVLIMLLALDGQLSGIDPLILIIGIAGYILYSIWIAKGERKRTIAEKERNGIDLDTGVVIGREIIFFVIGAACVILGSRWLVNGSEFIARRLGVPDLIIGITLVALGTSLPEYVTALTATIKGHQEISVGNIMGANILDIFWVLGGSSLFASLPIQKQTKVLDLPFMLLLMTILTVFAITGRRLRRWEGGVIVGIYAIYLAIMFTKFMSP